MRTSTVATASTKVTLITSNHNLPLSSTCKVLYFLFSRINNLNRNFLRWHFFQLFAPLKDHTDFIPSVIKRVQRWRASWKNVLSAIRNKVYRQNCSRGIIRFRIVYDDQLKRSVSCVSTNAFLFSVRKTEGKCQFQIWSSVLWSAITVHFYLYLVEKR